MTEVLFMKTRAAWSMATDLFRGSKATAADQPALLSASVI